MLGYAHRDIKSFLVPPNCKRYIRTTLFLFYFLFVLAYRRMNRFICICSRVYVYVYARARVCVCACVRASVCRCVSMLRTTIVQLSVKLSFLEQKEENSYFAYTHDNVCFVCSFQFAFCYFFLLFHFSILLLYLYFLLSYVIR